MLLEAIVEKLAEQNIKMQFKPEFFADDIPYSHHWISQLMQAKGHKRAPEFMGKIGMITGIELFHKMQEHNRVSETAQERKKITILQKAAELMELEEEDRKDIWIFSREAEKNIIHGQYMPDFFWFARERFQGSFFDALHTYVHEAAHKAGPHGEAQFEYTLQDYIKKVQLFMHNSRAEYEGLEKEWNSA